MPSAAAPVLRRILAVKLADLGDLLTVSPALQALRAAHPGARIDLLVPPSSASLLKGAPYLDNILSFDKFAFDSIRGLANPVGLWRALGFLRALRRARYDAVALFHHFTLKWGSVKFAILAYASGAPTRAGLDNGRGIFLTHRIADEGFGAMHEADYWLQVAALLGANPGGGWRPHIPIDEADRRFVAELLRSRRASSGGPLVAVHPGAGWYSRARIWPVDRFAAVARWLIDTQRATIAILGGPDEIGLAGMLQQLTASNGSVWNLAGQTTIRQTAAMLERCQLFVGNDSGPMHLSAAVGTPVVAVFGPSNSRAWGPYTPPGEVSRHHIVSRDLPCVPCFYRKHSLGLREGCGPRPCLTGLSPERVIAACTEVFRTEDRGGG